MELEMLDKKTRQSLAVLIVPDQLSETLLAKAKLGDSDAELTSLRKTVSELEQKLKESDARVAVVSDVKPDRKIIVAFLADASPDDVVALVTEAGHAAEIVPAFAPLEDATPAGTNKPEATGRQADRNESAPIITVVSGMVQGEGYKYLGQLDISVRDSPCPY